MKSYENLGSRDCGFVTNASQLDLPGYFTSGCETENIGRVKSRQRPIYGVTDPSKLQTRSQTGGKNGGGGNGGGPLSLEPAETQWVGTLELSSGR